MVLEGDSGRLERAGENAATRNVQAARSEGQGIARAGAALASGVAEGINNFYKVQQWKEQMKNGQADRAMVEQRMLETQQKMQMMAQMKQLEMLTSQAQLQKTQAEAAMAQFQKENQKEAYDMEMAQAMNRMGEFLDRDASGSMVPHRYFGRMGEEGVTQVKKPVPKRQSGGSGSQQAVLDWLMGAEENAAEPTTTQAPSAAPTSAEPPAQVNPAALPEPPLGSVSLVKEFVRKAAKKNPDLMKQIRQRIKGEEASEGAVAHVIAVNVAKAVEYLRATQPDVKIDLEQMAKDALEDYVGGHVRLSDFPAYREAEMAGWESYGITPSGKGNPKVK